MVNPVPVLSLRKRLFFLAVLVFFSLLLALLSAEIGIRLFQPQPLVAPLYQNTSFGYALLPNLREEFTQSDGGIPYRLSTNRLGFRGRREIEPRKKSGTARVLVLGDSFPFGVGVSDLETFPALTEELLNQSPTSSTEEALRASSGRLWEVFNLGCPGWGTENALAFWDQRGRDLQADLLVLTFYKNDFSDNMRHALYRVRDGEALWSPHIERSLLKRVVRALPFYRFLCGHSHLLNFVRRSLEFRAMAARTAPAPEGKETPTPEAVAPVPIPSAAESWEARRQEWTVQLEREKKVYRTLMECLLQDAKSRKIPVLILLLAGTEDLVYPWPSDQLKEATRLAREWGESGLADSVETLEALRQAQSAGRPIFLSNDGHLTPEGNRLVAGVLAGKIRTMRLFGSSPTSLQQEGAP
jgi:hypothetical protein